MRLRNITIALLGFLPLTVAVPTNIEHDASLALEERNIQKRSLIVNQFVQETSLTVVNLNLDVIDDLTKLAEQQFGLLIQSQLALASQLQIVKNNIRVNHFKARFAQINTVIVTVQTVVDFRDSGKANNRYLINQLYCDNGFADKQFVVMVSDVETMTIYATPTANVDNIFGIGASLESQPTAAPIMAAFDPAAPFGALNDSILLPAGAPAPSLDFIFSDPASIIYPHSGLFVESGQSFLTSCNFYFSHANAFVDLTATFFASFTQIAAVQLRGLGSFFLNPTVTAPSAATFTSEVIDETETAEAEDKDEKKKEENDKGKEESKDMKDMKME